MRFPFVLTLFTLSTHSPAAIRTVTHTADDGPGSLRYTINTAEKGDTIVFSPTAFPGNATIRLTTGPIVLGIPLTVTGPKNAGGQNQITLTGDRDNSGGYTIGDSHVFETKTGGIRLENFNITASGSSQSGGAIVILLGNAAPVTVAGCHFTGNRSSNGGALYSINNHPVHLIDCTFTNNTTSGTGGAIHFRNGSSFLITSCTFTGNVASNGGAIHLFKTTATVSGSSFAGNSAASGGGAIFMDAGSTLIQQCAFSANQATGGGGIDLSGGTTGGTATVRNSTFHGNATTAGGSAIRASGTSTFTVAHCTITGNTSNRSGGTHPGGAIQNALDAPVRLSSSIIAGNIDARSSGTKTPDIHRIDADILSDGGNLLGNDTGLDGASFPSPVDRSGTAAAPLDPGLLPFGNHGGPTPTCPPHPLSPAVDFAIPGGPAIDQRGRPRPQGIAADSGAFERDVIPYAGWADEALSDFPPADRLASEDPDQDGIPNALEYLFGSDPAVPAPSGYRHSIQDGHVLLSFPVSDTASLSEINTRLAESPDLAEWTFSNLTGHPSAALQGTTGSTYLYRLSLPATGTPRRFFRIVTGD